MSIAVGTAMKRVKRRSVRFCDMVACSVIGYEDVRDGDGGIVR